MRGLIRPAGHFLWHLVEMCAVMCVGMAVLDLLFFGVARGLGFSDPLAELPVLSTLVVALNMSLPMVAWMRFRGMAWVPTLEMSAAMFIEAFALIGLYWLGLVSAGATGLFAWQHALMMPAMIIAMLFRLDMYTRAHGHTAIVSKAIAAVGGKGRRPVHQ